jgi:uncharacterized protein YxjI
VNTLVVIAVVATYGHHPSAVPRRMVVGHQQTAWLTGFGQAASGPSPAIPAVVATVRRDLRPEWVMCPLSARSILRHYHGVRGTNDRGLAVFGRKRRQQRRFDRAATRYQMRQRMISIGDDYTIENDRGERVFRLDGKVLRIRKTILFADMEGRELCKIQERMLRLKDSMEIEGPDGNRIAIVKKAMVAPLRQRWVIKCEDGPDLRIQGNILDHEYRIERDGTKVAEVSKRWFRVRDTYGVEVAPGENDVLILASTAVLDTMAYSSR